MPTWCTICYQGSPSLVSYRCWTKHQSTGTLRNRLPSKLLPLVQNMLPPILLLSKSLSCALLCVTLVSWFVTTVISLVTTTLSLVAPPPLMKNCLRDMSCSPSTRSVMWLLMVEIWDSQQFYWNRDGVETVKLCVICWLGWNWGGNCNWWCGDLAKLCIIHMKTQ